MSYVPYYDKDGQPIDLMTWSNLYSDETYKRIANTLIVSAADLSVAYNVSTVWLGTNMNFVDHGPPVIFETMVFGDGPCDLSCERYATDALARRGHDDMVTVVASTVDHPVLMDAVDSEWETAASPPPGPGN